MYAQINRKSNQVPQTTNIDDLLDIEEFEHDHAMQGVGEHNNYHGGQSGGNVPQQYQKFIRNHKNGQQYSESGMIHHTPVPEFFEPPPQQQQHQHIPAPLSSTPTCLEVHDHVQTCPICSRFFKNDNTVYIIAIVILAIICILLLKRVLNL